MLSAKVLKWYDKNHRTFPWRKLSHQKQDPYITWLSEIMLQQTTTTTVIPYFEKFLGLWPRVEDLASADRDDVLHAWAGLGYYARARNLHACAQKVVLDFGGQFPKDVKDLLLLPGIGPYTAAAVAAIAYDTACAPIDGNIARIFSRVWEIDENGPRLHRHVHDKLIDHVPDSRNGDFVQALMDIGANICTPKTPQCQLCPIKSECQAFKHMSQALYPKKKEKPARPKRYGIVYWAQRSDGALLYQRRPDKGLLGGMNEFPSTAWTAEPSDKQQALEEGPIDKKGVFLSSVVTHVFSHFELELTVLKGPAKADEGYTFILPQDLNKLALPTVMKKVVKVASGSK